ncbi:Cation transport ATPase [Furfurilactobacillus rossiae]|nr:Cation transport ATPase [Furfurilactobacillus rossiae]QLE67989.1 Cation transport ATPase [Furfurilactobacillus rossiae]
MSQNPNTAPDAPDPKPSPVYVQTETEVLDHFHSDLETGLTAETAADRLAKNGPNELTAHVTPKWLIFLRQFNNVIIYILLFAAAFTLFIRHYSDAVVIGLLVIINALIGYFQEVNASNALDKIKSMLSTEATVIRDSAGQTCRPPS